MSIETFQKNLKQCARPKTYNFRNVFEQFSSCFRSFSDRFESFSQHVCVFSAPPSSRSCFRRRRRSIDQKKSKKIFNFFLIFFEKIDTLNLHVGVSPGIPISRTTSNGFKRREKNMRLARILTIFGRKSLH